MSETEAGKRILEVLREHGDQGLFTRKVAELSNLSPSTAAKYLYLLEKEGKVIMREQKPFKFWMLKAKKG